MVSEGLLMFGVSDRSGWVPVSIWGPGVPVQAHNLVIQKHQKSFLKIG